MGLGRWLQDAVATVTKSLTGRKRKAPDEEQEEDDEQAGLLPPPPPSSERPALKAQDDHLQAGPAVRRGPQRLDFSTPAMNGRTGDGADGNILKAEHSRQQAGVNHLGPSTAARRLDESLTAVVVLAGTSDSQQQAPVPAGSGRVPHVHPFAKRFVPPRTAGQLRSGVSSLQLLNDLRHVRDAPPSHNKLGLTPATQQRRHLIPSPRIELGQVKGLFTGGKQAAIEQQQRQEQQQRRQPRQHYQQPQQQAGGVATWHGAAPAGRAPTRQSNSQDAALLRRAVEVNLRQEERQQHQQQQPAKVVEVDLTSEPSPSLKQAPWQQQQPRPQQAHVPTAAAGAAPTLAEALRLAGPGQHWREMLRQVLLQDEELQQLGGEALPPPFAAPSDAGQQRLAQAVAEAQVARRRVLQAQEQEVQFVRRAHTALEAAQPGRAEALDAEARKIQRQLEELRLQRRQQEQQQQQEQQRQQQQQRRQKQQERKPVKPAAQEEDVVELLSSDEEEALEPSVSMAPAATEEEEESEVSQQLERVGLEEEEGIAPSRIPDAWREEYETALAPGPPGEVLCDHKRSSISISRRDMACMAPLQWLNDEVINLYISLLLERDALRRKQGKGPRCHFFSTFFANKLYKDTGYDYNQVRRWTLPKRLAAAGQASDSILDCDRIVVPVHQGLHWVCAVIDLQHQKLIYYDSLKGEDHNCLKQLARYVRDEYANKRNEQRDDVLHWPREFPKRIPQQHNGCDCGVFTLLFANYAGRAAPMNFSQAHINDFRVRIVHELLQLRVE